MREIDISLAAGVTDAVSTDLTLSPSPRSGVVVCSAGEPLSFAVAVRVADPEPWTSGELGGGRARSADPLGSTCTRPSVLHATAAHCLTPSAHCRGQPRDKFSNGRDETPSNFSWTLMRLVTVEREGGHHKDKERDEPTQTATPVQEGTLESLESTSLHLEVTGDYELHLTLHGKLVKGRPTKIRIEPAALSAAHCTLHGSGLHTCYMDPLSSTEREIFLTARDRFSNRLGRGGLSLHDDYQFSLRSLNPETPSLLIDYADHGEGVYRGAYGVRIMGEFQVGDGVAAV